MTCNPPAHSPDLPARKDAVAWMDTERLNLHALELLPGLGDQLGERWCPLLPGSRAAPDRGLCGSRRQVPAARVALLTPGGFFFNAQGPVLRAG